MQVTTAAPRAAFTDPEVREALDYGKGGVVRWGVDVLDSAGVSRTTVTYLEDSPGDWNAGTHLGTVVTGNALTKA